MLVFRYKDHQKGNHSGVFLSEPSKEALELFQQVGPKMDGRVLLSSLVHLGPSRGAGDGTAGGRDGSSNGPHLLFCIWAPSTLTVIRHPKLQVLI